MFQLSFSNTRHTLTLAVKIVNSCTVYSVFEKMYKDIHQMKYFFESAYKDLSFSVIGGVKM